MLNKLKARFTEFHAWSSLATRQTGKGVATQLREIHALRRFGGQCGVSDYYWYKLYDDAYQRGRGAPDFLGWRLEQQLSLALNPRHAVLPAWDKLAFMTIAGPAGLPVAPLRAYYHRARMLPASIGEHLGTPAAAAAFLREPGNFPVFAKPAFSQQGVGSEYLSGYDRASDALVLLGGKTIPVERFVQGLESSMDKRYHRAECGMLFQQALTLAPELHALTNWNALCGARIICLNDASGVKPILGLWKVANPPNHVDNFSKGKYGNLMGNVDLATGAVTRMLNGIWPRTAIHLDNPATGARLEGVRLPGWDRMLEACRLGGAVFPLMRIQHWDFALTDRGPVILELNDLGGTIGSQLYGHGLLTEEIRAFLRRHANPGRHPWVAAL